MDSTTLTWVALIAGAIATGGSLVGALVLRRSVEPIIGLIGLLSFLISASSFIALSTHYGRVDAVLYAFAFIIAAVGGGYALTSSLLDRLARPDPVVEPLESAPQNRSGPAVVIVACIEPESYEPAATASMLQALTDEGLLDASMGALPFVFFAQKARYRAVGGTSPAHRELITVAGQLESSLPGWTVSYAACSGPERLPAKVRSLAHKGHHPIVVAQLAVAQAGHLTEAKRQTDALRLDEVGVTLEYTDGLSDAERIGTLVASRVMQSVDDPPSTGVVLVGHGQPEDRSRTNPDFDEDENRFMNRVRLMLLDRGLPEANVRVAWAEWRTPDITSSVRHLAALGCRRVIVSPACYPLDTISTRLDIEISVRQARVEDSVAVVTLPAWREDTLLLDELRERVTSAAGID